MRLGVAWTIASKDLDVLRRKRSVLAGLFAFPLGAAIGLPLVLRIVGRQSGGIPPAVLPGLLDAFALFFLIGAATLPTTIASYTLVGEKVERSLEPLLATPTTDGEILLGKTLAAFLPPLLATWVGTVVFATLSDLVTRPALGHFYFPNLLLVVIALVLAPLSCLVSVEASVLVSTRVSDVRSAQQLAGLIVLPYAALYVGAEVNAVSFTTTNILLLSAALAAVCLGLFVLTRSVFRRDEILTRWK